MQKIIPFLWFDTQAEEAVDFYTSVFKDSKIGNTSRLNESVLVISFELNGQEFTALNGGPHFKFTEAVSFVVNCKDQEEIDYYWEKLTEGGSESQCGWLKDKFGLSWQIVPTILGELSSDPDNGEKVMQALMKMIKIDISELKKAAEGK
ncbi:VOC family protein [soil metagenome]